MEQVNKPEPRRRRPLFIKEPDNLANTANTTATNDDLAGLGLDLGGLSDDAAADLAPAKPIDSAAASDTSAVVSEEVATAEATDVGTKKTREHVEVGEIAIEEDVPLVALTRNSGGSKYKFSELRAPIKKADGTFSYASFRVDLQKGVDEDALKRSVQSANTQENKKHKDEKGGYEGEDIYYLTRSVTENGKFTAIRVYRVDGTIAK